MLLKKLNRRSTIIAACNMIHLIEYDKDTTAFLQRFFITTFYFSALDQSVTVTELSQVVALDQTAFICVV